MPDEARRISNQSILNFLQRNIVGVAVVVVALFLVIPMPRILIDFSMALNIAFSIVVLLIVMYTPRATNFITFPRVLLFMTLFGLGINISSTRLILANPVNPAGLSKSQSAMVQAFANIVTGGGAGATPVVIGFVIFIILIVVQVVVITKGATRVSEVAARFSLDSMSTKKFDIGNRLNSGIITEEEAQKEQEALDRSVDFYSTMDGASKFVSGNVKAGIFITAINIFGGFAVGMAINRMSAGDALLSYAKLTIGDGLMSQIPSLMLSFATGLIVTGSSTDEAFDKQLSKNFSVDGHIYEIVGAALAFMGIAFIGNGAGATVLLVLLGAFFFFMGYRISSSQVREKAQAAAAVTAKEKTGGASPADTAAIAPLDTLSLELGYALIPLVDKENGAELVERIGRIRHEAALDMGLIVPPIRILDNMTLDPNEYSFKIRGIEAGRSTIRLGYYMCMNNGTVTEELQGEKTKDPAFGMNAIWLPEEKRAEAERNGYTVVDPPTIIATHLTEIIKAHAAEIIGRQEVSRIINNIKETNPVVVDEVLNSEKCKFTYGDIEKVLKMLLQERVSIRNIVIILETLANFGPVTHNAWDLAEKVREALGLQICKQYVDEDDTLRVMSLSQGLSQLLLDHVAKSAGTEPFVALDPVDLRMWERAIHGAYNALRSKGSLPIVMCSSVVRRLVWNMTNREMPDIIVISDREIIAAGRSIKVEVLGEIAEEKAGVTIQNV
ncbi:flagellar biosynthesis protein FlhA [Treponema sp. Marseille-Q4130]|uniref:flagellar biosynthesis protein FlhA n=1 Tax=Treponema sp. Marseille-Q4130 TaxID=2766702 RepID=UPI001651BDBE|nr:flagellar biosynthesis protein FlhA [Treponema sp. Marseille-Q4130]MBC6721138.1 FHIPEP family type III secretion protein [Treponema sp. Marseille-Q4130]